MTTDLNILSKTELNALLASPLTAAKLKKTSKADLIAMFDDMPASDALDADLRDARDGDDPTPPNRVDDSEALTPTPLTDLEKRVLVAYLDAGIGCNGADTLDAMLADNMTWGDAPEIAQRTGLKVKAVVGVMGSLAKKDLLVITDEGVNGEGPLQQVLSDNGVRVAFNLLAEGVEATAPTTEQAPNASTRGQDDRVIVPAGKPEDVKPTKEGSKRAILIQALARGATLDHLVELLGWNKATVSSALRWDVKQMGLGVERRGGKYYLLLPEGVKRPPLRNATTSRAEALVAACK